MFLEIEKAKRIPPYLVDASAMTPKQRAFILVDCPVLDITDPNCDIERFLLDFFCYYAEQEKGTFTLESSLYDEVEKRIFAKAMDVAVEDVTYGVLFSDDELGARGGISEKGMALAILFMFDFKVVTGMSFTTEKSENGIEIDESNIDDYFDCDSIGDIAKILKKAKIKYEAAKAGKH